MKAKQLLSLIIIFFIATGIFVAKKVFLKEKLETKEYTSLEISFNPSHVKEIKIEAPNSEGVSLINKDNDWVVASRWNLEAERPKIEMLIAAFSNLTGELRSASKGLLGDYGITEGKAYSITISTEDSQPQKFFIGAKKPSPGKTFLRKNNSNAVYLVNADIFSLFGIEGDGSLDQNFWVDLKLLRTDIDKIESIQIVKSIEGREVSTVWLKKELDTKKDLKHWVVVGEKKPVFDIDASKIRSFIARLNNLRAIQAVKPGSKDYGLGTPFLRIILGNGKGRKELIVGNEVSGQSKERYVATSKDSIYTISDSRLKNLDIDISKFFIDNPLRIDKKSLESISISTPGGKRLTLNKDLIGENMDYVEKLKKFSVKRLLFSSRYPKGLSGAAVYQLVILKSDGSNLTLNVNAKEIEKGEFISWVKDNKGVFYVIGKKVYENLFEGLDQLNLGSRKGLNK